MLHVNHANKKKHAKVIPLIKTLKRLNRKELGNVLPLLSNNDIDLLCCCGYNIMYHDIGLSKKRKNALRKKFLPFKKKLQFLCKKSKEDSVIDRKRKLMVGGNFFIPLLAAALPAIINLFKR